MSSRKCPKCLESGRNTWLVTPFDPATCKNKACHLDAPKMTDAQRKVSRRGTLGLAGLAPLDRPDSNSKIDLSNMVKANKERVRNGEAAIKVVGMWCVC